MLDMGTVGLVSSFLGLLSFLLEAAPLDYRYVLDLALCSILRAGYRFSVVIAISIFCGHLLYKNSLVTTNTMNR